MQPGSYALPDDEVHVWLARLDLPWSAGPFLELLATDERQKSEHFRFQHDRDRYVIGRVLVRILLGHLLHVEPASLRFHYNDFGKPYLSGGKDERRLRFNVSHSGQLILVALAADRHIGVDVERVREDLDIEAIAARFFSARERADLAVLSPSQKSDAFFRCWSRKEAFIKAKGEGLTLPLDRFDVSLLPGEPAMLRATRPDPVEANRWDIRDLDVGLSSQAAVAVEGGGWQLKITEWLQAGGHDERRSTGLLANDPRP